MDSRLTVPCDPNDVVAELLGVGLRHSAHPSSGTLSAPQIRCHLLVQQSPSKPKPPDGSSSRPARTRLAPHTEAPGTESTEPLNRPGVSGDCDRWDGWGYESFSEVSG